MTKERAPIIEALRHVLAQMRQEPDGLVARITRDHEVRDGLERVLADVEELDDMREAAVEIVTMMRDFLRTAQPEDDGVRFHVNDLERFDHGFHRLCEKHELFRKDQ